MDLHKDKNWCLYLIMRNDLVSMNPGKLAAQAAHVANAFVKAGKNDKFWNKKVIEWEQTAKGFGTTIVLQAEKLAIDYLCDCYPKFPDNLSQFPDYFGPQKIIDPTYPCWVDDEMQDVFNTFTKLKCEKNILIRPEMVGCYVFGDKNNQKLQKITRSFDLYD